MLTEYLTTAGVISLIVSVVIPLLSSLLAKAHWPGEVVGILTLLIAAANGFFTEWAQAGSGFNWRHALLLAVASFVVAVLSRYGLWKGTVTDGKALAFPSKADPFVRGLRGGPTVTSGTIPASDITGGTLTVTTQPADPPPPADPPAKS